MKKISFDFDNTIAMSFMTYIKEEPIPVFQSYNDKIIKKIKKHIKNKDDVYIVTARTSELEQYFPDQTVEKHLEKLGLKDYFWPDRVIFTAGQPKVDILHDLGVEKHYDDSIEEHFDALDAKYEIIQPLDDFKDSETVGKVCIFDDNEKMLILQRSDEGHLWDLPGGHLKNVEIARGEQGYEDGTEREVFEETGIMVPFIKEFMDYDFNHKGLVHKIHLYLSKIEGNEPHIRLDLQDHIENIDYRWVSIEDLSDYMGKTTTNLRKAYDMISIQDEIFEHTEPFQLKMKKKHQNAKRKLIGFGKNKHFGGGKGHKRAKMTRSKSAPPLGESIKEEFMTKSEKFRKIKVKVVQRVEEKRKKSRKKHGIGGYYPYYDMYDSQNLGDSGGDGGE